MGLMKLGPAGNQVIYVTPPLSSTNEKFLVLSPDNTNRRYWCCITIRGTPLQTGFDPHFLNMIGDNGHDVTPVSAYHALMLDSLNPFSTGLGIVVSAKSVAIGNDGYRVTDNGGTTYIIDSCFGIEGLNVYLRSSQTHAILKHYYGYLNYDIEGDCPNLESPSTR